MIKRNTNEELSFIYTLHKSSLNGVLKNELSLSIEEIFWYNFVKMSYELLWDNNSRVKVNLSEVLKLYLSIYREDIAPEITLKEEANIYERLKEKFYKVNQIFRQIEEYGTRAVVELGKLIVIKDANIIRQIQVGHCVLSAINTLSDGTFIPLKLVKDV